MTANRLTIPPTTTTWKPARAPSPQADALTPLLIGLEVGAVALLALGAGGWLVGWAGEIILRFAPAVGVVGLIGGLAYGFATAHGTLHETIEVVTGRDLDGDGVVGKPPHYVTTNQPLPLDADERKQRDLWRFLAWSYRTHKTSLEEATAAGFSESAWTDCYRVLRAAGVTEATRAGESAGWKLTPTTAQACWQEVQKGNGGFYLQ